MIGTANGLAAKFISSVQHLPQQFARMLTKMLTLGGELRRIDPTIDQIKTEPRLKGLDAAAERGLGGVTLLRGTREVAGFGNREEVLKPTQLHSIAPTRPPRAFVRCLRYRVPCANVPKRASEPMQILHHGI